MLVLLGTGLGCSSKRSAVHGKRVALVEVAGVTGDSRTQLEASLVNAIIDHGHFEIVSKDMVDSGKFEADYHLTVEAVDYRVEEREGYDKIEEEDSLLTAEHRSDKPLKGTRFLKVKNYNGVVRLKGRFVDPTKKNSTIEISGQAEEAASTRDAGAPRKLQLLERVSRKAVDNFFENLSQKSS